MVTSISKFSTYSVFRVQMSVSKFTPYTVFRSQMAVTKVTAYTVFEGSLEKRPRRTMVTVNFVPEPRDDLTYDLKFTSPVVGAWGLRQLVSVYAGPIIRIIGSDNVEKDLFATDTGDLEPWTPTAIDKVMTIYDQSGNGAHLIAPTAAARPEIIVDGSPKGKPVARFDGVNHWMYDGVSATNRPYMVSNPTTIWFGGGRGPRATNAIIWCVPARGAATGSPFQRWSMAWVAGTGVNANYEQAANGSFVRGLLSNLTSHAGWTGIVACRQFSQVFETRTTAVPVTMGSGPVVGYPLATRLIIGADATGVGKWGHDFMELVFLDGAESTLDATKDVANEFYDHLLEV